MSQKKPQGRRARFSDSPEYQESARVTLDPKTRETLRAFGAGNLSAGIRRAAALLREIRETLN